MLETLENGSWRSDDREYSVGSNPLYTDRLKSPWSSGQRRGDARLRWFELHFGARVYLSWNSCNLDRGTKSRLLYQIDQVALCGLRFWLSPNRRKEYGSWSLCPRATWLPTQHIVRKVFDRVKELNLFPNRITGKAPHGVPMTSRKL